MALVLEAKKRAGEIVSYRFEAIKLRLADRTTYTPDFAVVLLDRRVAFVEVKGGFVREDAAVKLKIAAELYPEFTFTLAQWSKGQWSLRQMPGAATPSATPFPETIDG